MQNNTYVLTKSLGYAGVEPPPPIGLTFSELNDGFSRFYFIKSFCIKKLSTSSYLADLNL